MILLVEPEAVAADSLRSVLPGDVVLLTSLEAVRRHLDDHAEPDVVVLGPSLDLRSCAQFASTQRVVRPAIGCVLVRRRVDTPVLAEAMRAGMREVVEERDLAALSRAATEARRLAVEIRSASGGREAGPELDRGIIVTVFAAKGGAGKTTLATNLAAALADGGRREVCLVDLDLAFGDVAITLQLFPAHTIADAVPLHGQLDEAAVRGLLTPHSPGLTTLVAPVQPDAKESIRADLISRILEILRSQFDYVVVDTPPAFDDQVLAAFDRTDLMLLVASLDVPALKNLKLTLETLDLLNFPKERWHIVLNRADAKVGLAPSEVEKTLRAQISAQIPSSRDVPASINRGVAIVQDDPRHPVSQAIRALADRIAAERHSVGREPAVAAAAPRRWPLRRRMKTS